MSTNRKPSIFNRVGGFIDFVGSAAAVTSAVENGRDPRARDLKALGIEPEQFRSIGKF